MDDQNQSQDRYTTTPAPQVPVAAPMPAATTIPASKYKLPTVFKTSLVLFGLVASAILAIIPSVSQSITSSNIPNFIIFLIAGIVGIITTALIFRMVSKLGMGFNRTVIVMAIGYNVMIAVVKLTLAPMALYLANLETEFEVGFIGDPNNITYYVILGVIVMLLYMSVFWLVYRHFSKHFEAKQTVPSTQNPIETPKKKIGSTSLIVLAILIGLILFGVGGFFTLPLLFVMDFAKYLTYIFSTVGLAILAALITAIILAYKSFSEAEKQAVETGDATILASFLWVGLSLILLYHVMWVVFMVALVTTWPFKTYTPK